jgi:glycosyltransferase involved in cell wall biosynthesis
MIGKKGSNSVAFIPGQLGLGGAEKQLYLLVKGLVQEGWRVSTITLNSDKGEDYWEGPLRELGIRIHAISRAMSRSHRLLEVKRILRQESVDIVHSWSMHTNFYAAAGGRLSGTVVRLGSERCNHHSSHQVLGRWGYALSLCGLDGLVVNSAAAAGFLRRYRPRINVRIVVNGVEIPEPPATEEVKQRLRAQLGISNSSLVIGAVGSMVPRKNFKALINAVSVLGASSEPAVLVLMGDGPLRAELQRQALANLSADRVVFPGVIPDAAAWYPAFDLLCSSSLDEEGMPNVLMEAAAAGLPVVATAVGGALELVEDGVNGFLVPPDNIDAMVQKLEKLLRDPDARRRMGQAGREKMRRKFSVAAMVAHMTQVYEEMLPCGRLETATFHTHV